MPVTADQVKVGSLFITAGQQLRKVTRVFEDNKKRQRVNYQSKSARLEKRKLDFAGTQANPALMTTFCNACDHKLSKAEITDLLEKGILASQEL